MDDPQVTAGQEAAVEDVAGEEVTEIPVYDPELQGRLWLRAILPVLELRSGDPASSPRVQLAFDAMLTEACERLVRILGSDINQ